MKKNIDVYEMKPANFEVRDCNERIYLKIQGSLFGEKEILRNEEKKYSKRRALEKLNSYDLRLKTNESFRVEGIFFGKDDDR